MNSRFTGDQTLVTIRTFIEQPVPGVLYSLQSRDGEALDPRASHKGELLTFDFPVRVAPGPMFSGDRVRREGAERRFVYIRIGQLAGDKSSPWSRRMKIEIYDIGKAILDRAAKAGSAVELRVSGTGEDGTPACATVQSARCVGA